MYDRKLCQLMMMERDTVAVTLTVWWTPSDTRHMSTVVRWSQPEPENQVLGSWIFTVKHFVVFYLNLKAFSLGKCNLSFAEYNKGYCDIVTTMTMLWPGHQHWPVSGPGVVLQYSVHSNYSHGTMCQITTTKWKNIFIFKPKQILRLISLKWNTHHTTRHWCDRRGKVASVLMSWPILHIITDEKIQGVKKCLIWFYWKLLKHECIVFGTPSS